MGAGVHENKKKGRPIVFQEYQTGGGWYTKYTRHCFSRVPDRGGWYTKYNSSKQNRKETCLV